MSGTLLHLIDTGGPGGAETVFLRVAAGLDARGWRAVPVVNRDAWLARELRAAGLQPIVMSSKGSLNVEYLRALCHLARSSKARALVTHLYGSAVYGGVAGRLTRRPVVSVLHGQTDVGTEERFAWIKSQVVGHGAVRLVAVSEHLRQALECRIAAPPQRWTVIPNGVDTQALRAGGSCGLRHRLAIPSDAVVVGALGNIRRPKGYDVFLRAAAELARSSDRLQFVIGGEAKHDLMNELLALRDDLGLQQRVHFAGLQTDVRGFLGDIDVFLLTSSTEGFSIACVEAMACGLPVVATRSGGPEEIVVDQRTGFLCPVGDFRALADRVRQLAGSAELRARMGAAGRQRAVERFSLDAMLDAYEAIVRSAVR